MFIPSLSLPSPSRSLSLDSHTLSLVLQPPLELFPWFAFESRLRLTPSSFLLRVSTYPLLSFIYLASYHHPPPRSSSSPSHFHFSFSHQLIITTLAIPFEFRRDFALLFASCSLPLPLVPVLLLLPSSPLRYLSSTLRIRALSLTSCSRKRPLMITICSFLDLLAALD